MGKPIWLDENGQRAQTRTCSRPTCDREYPIVRYRYRTIRTIGWQLYRVTSIVNWCGHGQEFMLTLIGEPARRQALTASQASLLAGILAELDGNAVGRGERHRGWGHVLRS